MKHFLFLLVLLPAVFGNCVAFGQAGQRTISGIVTSFEESLPLEGVQIMVKGSSAHSGSQADGIYYIRIDSSDSVLIFSLSGYQSKEVKISSASEYNVVLTAGGTPASSPVHKEPLCGIYPSGLSRCCR